MADNVTDTFDGLYSQDSSDFAARMTTSMSNQAEALKEISSILKDIQNTSQSFIRDYQPASRQADYRNVGQPRSSNDVYNARRARRASGNFHEEFIDGFETAFREALGLTDFRSHIQESMSHLADELGVELQDLPGTIGTHLGEQFVTQISSSDMASRFIDQFKQGQDAYLARANREWENLADQIQNGGLNEDAFDWLRNLPGDVSNVLNNVLPDNVTNSPIGRAANTAMSAVTDVAGAGLDRMLETGVGQAVTRAAQSSLGTVVSGLGAEALAAVGGPAGVAAMAVSVALDQVVDFLSQIGASIQKFIDGLGKAADRDVTTRQKRLEEGDKRIRADIMSIVQAPFDILKEAAQKVEDAWDNALNVINQTQGYSKAELQDLLSAYAERIRSENLESVVSTADLISNLSKVLESGLSGQVAEEFSYLATKLKAAVPTEDFFNYSSTYAALAANAIKDGQSQSEAIEYANEQLELFASNILYASRQLAGGFSSGLTNASDLFQKAAEISVAARTDNPSELAGVLTSVSAITGAIAPDLAGSIVDAVYNAAVGGNSSEIVALRSLAGINASNTEFLRQFAADPQTLFSTLFTNLANLQNMSPDNYMEVSEGLSNVFGLDKSAFARVDFNYLAQAIENMNVSNAALNENMEQLISGESTLSAEQMKIRQINEYMIDEGLSYVLDNQVAREIQKHMWDEQLALEMQEATYAVDLRGDALSFINDLVNIARDILGFLNPASMLIKAINLVRTTIESATLDDRIAAVLKAGQVGQGNQAVLRNLTTVGQNLRLTNTYLSMLQESKSGTGSTGYTWASIGKSVTQALGTQARGSQAKSMLSAQATEENVNLARMESNFDKMLNTMSNYFGENVQNKIDTAIEDEAQKLAQKSISDAQVKKLAETYVSDPQKYQIGSINYTSKLAESLNKDYVNELQERNLAVAMDKARIDLEAEAAAQQMQQARQNVAKRVSEGKFGQSGYEAWQDTAAKFGISDFEETVTELGYSVADLQRYFEELETQQGAATAYDRQQSEEKFWDHMQEAMDMLNANVHDVFDKGDIMGILWPGIDTWLADIDSNGESSHSAQGTGFRGNMNYWFNQIDTRLDDFFNKKWYNEYFTRYLKQHETYNSRFGYSVEVDENGNVTSAKTDGTSYTKILEAVTKAENDSNVDAINALAEAITSVKIEDLMDPTVQQNVFLAQILKGVQTIIQQNNTQGKLKLPDAIAAMATGMTTTNSSKKKK